MSTLAIGSRVQRIDGPRAHLIALSLHGLDVQGCLLLSAVERHGGWAFTDERPRGEPASSFVLLLRKHLEGARLLELAREGATGIVRFVRGEERAELELSIDPPNLRLFVDGSLIAGLRGPGGAAAALPASRLDTAFALAWEALRSRSSELVDAVAAAERAALVRAIIRERKRREKRLRAIEGDLGRVDDVAALRTRGSLILANLRSIPSDATEAIVEDWSHDPPQPLRIPIDPRRGPKGEADQLFKRARKLERGAEIAMARYAQTQEEIARLDALEKDLGEANTDPVALSQRAAKLGVTLPTVRSRAVRDATSRKPYREFIGSGGRPIWVGRSAADNDALTLRHARPFDLWLHARSVPGSHVVVPLDRNEAVPPDLLVDAAHLAAHFSDVRGEETSEVQYVARRYVRKPRGAAAGSVTVTHEKVLLVRLEADRLARLLASDI